jgi:integrin alpha 8
MLSSHFGVILQVELLDSYDKLTNATKRSSLEGRQPGEHFGASLAVFDIDNDGRDDIVVGAPHHTIYTNSEIKFDVGAVYVYFQTSKGLYEKENSLNITGQFSGGQFGFAVANLGDSNGDGYNDLAVGAPYEDGGSGVVYIYHGSHTKNLRKLPGQILKGSSYQPFIRSFGFSFISGASDFDGNGYGDLTVGAYESDIVVHIPARPVVRMTNKLTFSPNSITLEKKECTAKIGGSNVQVTCSKLKYCLNYDGKGVPGSINTNITIILDVQQPKAQRLLFLKTNQNIMTQIIGLSVKTELCQEEYVYVRPDIRDKLTSIEAQIVPTLVVTNAPLSPILDIYDGRNGRVTKSLPIFKDCGSDDICIPDLQMTVTT